MTQRLTWWKLDMYYKLHTLLNPKQGSWMSRSLSKDFPDSW